MNRVLNFLWRFCGRPVTVIDRDIKIDLDPDPSVLPVMSVFFKRGSPRLTWTTAVAHADQLWVDPNAWDRPMAAPVGGKHLVPHAEGIFWVKGWLISPRRRAALMAAAALCRT